MGLKFFAPLPSKLKAFLRRVGARTPETLQEALGQALLTITAHDALGWFTHCGYRSDPHSSFQVERVSQEEAFLLCGEQ
jgi:hypothetical protein